MKARIIKPNKYNMSPAEHNAMMHEINRQIMEADSKYYDALNAMVLYTLNQVFGFGPKRLRRFYDAMSEEHDKLVEYYQMPEDYPYLCVRELKKLGVDIEAWNRESK